jgi:hypothetical protein
MLFTPETLDQINQEVVKAGHTLLKKGYVLVSCCTFVYPSDSPRQINGLSRAL